jgi:hypothetical protein
VVAVAFLSTEKPVATLHKGNKLKVYYNFSLPWTTLEKRADADLAGWEKGGEFDVGTYYLAPQTALPDGVIGAKVSILAGNVDKDGNVLMGSTTEELRRQVEDESMIVIVETLKS